MPCSLRDNFQVIITSVSFVSKPAINMHIGRFILIAFRSSERDEQYPRGKTCSSRSGMPVSYPSVILWITMCVWDTSTLNLCAWLSWFVGIDWWYGSWVRILCALPPGRSKLRWHPPALPYIETAGKYGYARVKSGERKG